MTDQPSFNLDLLSFLHCPYCAGEIDLSDMKIGSGNLLEWGILRCSGCHNVYPVISGIPVFRMIEERVDVMEQTRNKFARIGPPLKALIAQIKSANYHDALRSILFAPPEPENFAPAWFSSVPGQRFLRPVRKWFGKSRLPRWQKQADYHVDHLEDTMTLRPLMHFFYQRFTKEELYYYFIYKFGQPRHLAALSLASLLNRDDGPLLDLACGLGHILHFLTFNNKKRIVFGLDRNFFQLFLAKKYIAPSAHFICGEADLALPFSDSLFFGIVCSDAFHYFQHKSTSVREMKRVIGENGHIVLARFGNKLVEPHEGYELSPQAYKSLFKDMANVLVSENSVLSRYLEKLGPPLKRENPIEEVNKEKWLSLVASHRQEILRNHDKFDDWPHAVGCLRQNPLYHKRGIDELGNERYEFRFPSKWYQFENQQWSRYAPRSVLLSRNILDALSAGKRTPEMEEWISHGVLLGMPEAYL